MSITVKRPEAHNIHALKKIWSICFGGTDEYINNFFEKAFKPENSLIAMYDFKPVGMMYTLPAMLKYKGEEYAGEYIYAAGVNPQYRNLGALRAMEDKATELAKANNLSFMTLIPQENECYKMYEKFGYKTSFYNSVRTHLPFKKDQVDGVSTRACDRDTFNKLREIYLEKRLNFIDLLPPYDNYRYAEIQDNKSDIMLIIVDTEKYYFTGFKRGSVYLIKETSLDEKYFKRVFPLIASQFNVDMISVRGKNGVADSITPYAMYKSLDGKITVNDIKCTRTYINLMLD